MQWNEPALAFNFWKWYTFVKEIKLCSTVTGHQSIEGKDHIHIVTHIAYHMKTPSLSDHDFEIVIRYRMKKKSAFVNVACLLTKYLLFLCKVSFMTLQNYYLIWCLIVLHYARDQNQARRKITQREVTSDK